MWTIQAIWCTLFSSAINQAWKRTRNTWCKENILFIIENELQTIKTFQLQNIIQTNRKFSLFSIEHKFYLEMWIELWIGFICEWNWVSRRYMIFNYITKWICIQNFNARHFLPLLSDIDSNLVMTWFWFTMVIFKIIWIGTVKPQNFQVIELNR